MRSMFAQPELAMTHYGQKWPAPWWFGRFFQIEEPLNCLMNINSCAAKGEFMVGVA